ncbi:MAG: hypothetical protein IMZ52_04430 [Actinobacteria bacterium]|nr:hypothetical protein [Actinomycetota bacterium]MBE3122034.1 hypothetical protein [Thermoplasmata archaeon]
MKLWKFPLLQRVISLDGGPGYIRCYNKEKLMELDHVGFFLKYKKEEDVKPEYIRRHIHFRESTWTLVDAPTVTQAINTFYNEWEGAKTGGSKEEQKALWIDRELNIIELPKCDQLNISKEKHYICGPEAFNGNGEFGMCVLENYDAPEGCAIDDYYDFIYDLEKAKCLPVKKIIIRGKEYKFLTVKDVMTKYHIFQQQTQEVVVI